LPKDIYDASVYLACVTGGKIVTIARIVKRNQSKFPNNFQKSY